MIAVTALLALAAGYSATRALVAARPAPEAGEGRESRGFRFEVEDATVRKVDLTDSHVELASDLLGLFGARLQVTDRTEIKLDGLEAHLADLPEGARVRASYELRDGLKVAQTISAEKPEPEPVSPPAGGR
jgi:hypothetical protein